MIVLTDYFGTNRYSDVVTVIYTLYITQVRHKVRHYTRCAALDNMVLLGSAPFAARLLCCSAGHASRARVELETERGGNAATARVAWVTGGGESGMGYRGKRPKQGFKTPPETSLRV